MKANMIAISHHPSVSHKHTLSESPLTPSIEWHRISCRHANKHTHLLIHTYVPPLSPAQRCNLHPSWNIEHPEREGAAHVTHHELADSWRRSPPVLVFSLDIPEKHYTDREPAVISKRNLLYSDHLFSALPLSPSYCFKKHYSVICPSKQLCDHLIEITAWGVLSSIASSSVSIWTCLTATFCLSGQN